MTKEQNLAESNAGHVIYKIGLFGYSYVDDLLRYDLIW